MRTVAAFPVSPAGDLAAVRLSIPSLELMRSSYAVPRFQRLENPPAGYEQSVPGYGDPFEQIQESLKRAAAALRDADVPFALGGSLAAWARGGPESCNDLDLMVKEEDAERALETLAEAGMRPERPPEEWLLKAWDGAVLIDLIHSAAGVPITDEVLGRADEMSVVSLTMRVLALEDVMVSKLMALNEHHLDYEPLLTVARAVREQVDWENVRVRTSPSPYARAFFALLGELELDTGARRGALAAGGDPSGPRVRVVPQA
jgi:predicted nucleotidyltransferase